jgi:hypothetical protein
MNILSPQWQGTLQASSLDDFNTVWEMPLTRVDSQNQARGGWSEVCRQELPEPVLGVDALYIKRQQDYGYREWPNIFSSKPTFYREARNLNWCIDHGVPVVQPLAYEDRKVDGHQRAILITAGLTDYQSLDSLDWQSMSNKQHAILLKAIARVIFYLHGQGMQHGCLYPKHIFVHDDFFTSGQEEIRLIDLEKARPISRWNGGIFRDLDSLSRRATFLTNEERLMFFNEYYQGDHAGRNALLEKLKKSLESI